MYRVIDTQIWEDAWFFELKREQKLLFIYLITSAHTNQLGVFRANIKYIEMETGIENVAEVLKGLYPKVLYYPHLNLIIIKNFIRYQNLGGENFEKGVANKFAEQNKEVQAILFRECEEIRRIVQKFNPALAEELENIKQDTLSIPHPYPINTLSIPHHTDTDTETDTGTDTDTGTETETIKDTSAIADEQAQASKEKTAKKREKAPRHNKYSPEVIDFLREFKTYREEFLKIPITQKDWHLKTGAVVNKLLKKYPLAELEQALEDLQTPVWEDKATKILELWHFEDWLPRWKAWKYPPTQSSLGSSQDNKYRRLYYEIYGRYPEES